MTSPPSRPGRTIGPLLARGREATVHLLGDRQVLRRYDDARDVSAEVAVMRHVARHGFPVPALLAPWPDGAGRPTGMVLERVRGPSLIEAAVAGRLEPEDVGRTLAGLHARLHAVPAAGLEVPPGAAPRPGDVVVHLDLHPANVLLPEDGPVVIDWAMARPGRSTLDTAMTAVTMGAAVLAGIPGDAGDVARLALPRGVLRTVLEAYLRALAESPAASLEAAGALVVRVGAQQPDVVRAAVELVREMLEP